MRFFFSVESSEDLFPEDPSCDRLTFYHFDVSRLLKHGASLLGSAGAEFEMQDDKTGLEAKGFNLGTSLLVWLLKGGIAHFLMHSGGFFPPSGKSASLQMEIEKLPLN